MRLALCFLLVCATTGYGQDNFKGRTFEQLDYMLPTPNSFRAADGSPGFAYWQQQADYHIKVELNDENQHIRGWEKITYHNNSGQSLPYLWLQLEQNMRSANSNTYKTHTSEVDKFSTNDVIAVQGGSEELGFNIEEVKDLNDEDLAYTVNQTMMRVDLEKPLPSGESFEFTITWDYYINDRLKVKGRSGYEYFEKDGNYLYTIAQFFPRLAVYDDVNGWQNKQFLGRGEFALPFGNYRVEMTVPADHMVASTGILQNPEEVLTEKQRMLLEKSRTSEEPVIIVSEEEARKNEKSKSKEKKTWIYEAENVRDFAWTSSRKFIWDAMGVDINGKTVMAMSYYPKEANPLYEKYSTRVVAHTLKFYSNYTFDYPYPKAISVEAKNGMEYPMICFNYGRPNEDGEYSDRLMRGMISVIIHEIGHNFFPMIVNSDERQWAWMDEGINSFVQYLAEQDWDPGYPSRRGPVENIIPYMKGSKDHMVPIMTNPEQLKQVGNNAYGKPASALTVLREVVMGKELFDYSFKAYANRWKFKHPTPADFFRTMEDASAIDLDWFWKGWFYTTDHVDLSLDQVTWYKYTQEIDNEKKERKINKDEESAISSLDQYQQATFALGRFEELSDPENNFYELKLRNVGGLVMPVILKINYRDGSSEIRQFPAEIWRKNEDEISKVILTKKEVESFELDPERKTADVDVSNNAFPRKDMESRFERFKSNN